jgi:hypothetical protein
MAFKILRHDQDGKTKMMRFTVQVMDGENAGQVETFAIYPRALALIHGPGEQSEETLIAAIRRWMKPMHEAAMERHRMGQMAGAAGESLVGKKLEFE